MTIDDREIYFETLTLGDLARVAAIDAASGIEVVVSGPATAARFELERLAKRRLARALIEAGVLDGDSAGSGGAGPKGGHPPGGRSRGRLV